jgi:hypothetical protein
VRALLQASARGERLDELEVTYDDVHPLWGGVAVTLGPGGRYERVERGPGGLHAASTRGHLPPEAIRALARLLLAVEAWEHRPPERPAFPDESTATLTVRCGPARATVWALWDGGEHRLRRVRDHLDALARARTHQG